MADPTSAPNLDPIANATADAVGALIDVINSGTTPQALEAQRILMERIALEGNVIPSRIPPPRNITEIGGYLNLLETLGQRDSEIQTLAGILGIAGANFAASAFAEPPPIAFTRIANDRPDGTAQATIPTHVTIRADFVDDFVAARDALHQLGCSLPLLSPARALATASTGAAGQPDPLQVLGRALDIVPAAVAVAPDSDPVAFARPAPGGATLYALVARELDGGTLVAAKSWEALTCDASACTPSTGARQYQPVAPLLVSAGWIPEHPTVAPTSNKALGSLTRFVNLTGLVAGRSRLRDELTLLYTAQQISASMFAPRLDDVWDGSGFSTST